MTRRALILGSLAATTAAKELPMPAYKQIERFLSGYGVEALGPEWAAALSTTAPYRKEPALPVPPRPPKQTPGKRSAA